MHRYVVNHTKSMRKMSRLFAQYGDGGGGEGCNTVWGWGRRRGVQHEVALFIDSFRQSQLKYEQPQLNSVGLS